MMGQPYLTAKSAANPELGNYWADRDDLFTIRFSVCDFISAFEDGDPG